MAYILECIIKFHIYEIKSKAGKIVQKNHIHFNIIQSHSCEYNSFLNYVSIESKIFVWTKVLLRNKKIPSFNNFLKKIFNIWGLIFKPFLFLDSEF